jgi:hypothetical protein
VAWDHWNLSSSEWIAHCYFEITHVANLAVPPGKLDYFSISKFGLAINMKLSSSARPKFFPGWIRDSTNSEIDCTCTFSILRFHGLANQSLLQTYYVLLCKYVCDSI